MALNVSADRRDRLANQVVREIDGNKGWDITENVEVAPDILKALPNLSRTEINAIAPHMLASSLLLLDESPGLDSEIQFLLSRKKFLLAELVFYGYQDEEQSLPSGLAQQLVPIVEELKLIRSLLEMLNREKDLTRFVINSAFDALDADGGPIGLSVGSFGSRHGAKVRKRAVSAAA